MPKRVTRVRLDRNLAQYAFFLGVLRWRPACAADLFAGGGGGAATGRWVERWGLPAWCAELGKRACRQRVRTPNVPWPAWAGFIPETAAPFRFEAPGWDWHLGEQRWHAAERLRRGFEAALAAHLENCEAELAAAGWEAVRGPALEWLVRRVVPSVAGGRGETALSIGLDAGVDESTVSRETVALARLLEIQLPGGDWRATEA